MQFLKIILPYLQVIISILLITAVILQQRGAGLGGAFGGSGTMYYTKRGFEKIIFIATIILSALFLLSTFLALII